MTGYAPLPRVDWSESTTVFEPRGDGEGHWVGAPCVHRHDGTTYLAVRWRSPDRRGYAVAVYERTGPDDFEERGRVTADDLGVESVERAALVTDPRSGDLRCYLPVDRGENDWSIRKLDDVTAPASLDPDSAQDVLLPGDGTDSVTVKDPCVVTLGGRYHMWYAGSDGESERAHLATSDDGVRWERAAGNPVLGRAGWHDHHVRVTCVLPAPDAPVWVALYGGSGRDDHGRTWNLRTGVAASHDLRTFVDVTPDAPALSAPVAEEATALDGFGTCRYVDVLRTPGGDELFAEVARPDGAFELRRCPLEWGGD